MACQKYVNTQAPWLKMHDLYRKASRQHLAKLGCGRCFCGRSCFHGNTHGLTGTRGFSSLCSSVVQHFDNLALKFMVDFYSFQKKLNVHSETFNLLVVANFKVSNMNIDYAPCNTTLALHISWVGLEMNWR